MNEDYLSGCIFDKLIIRPHSPVGGRRQADVQAVLNDVRQAPSSWRKRPPTSNALKRFHSVNTRAGDWEQFHDIGR